MVVSFPSTRIFSGCATLSVAVCALAWDKAAFRDGVKLEFTIDPSVAWSLVAILGILGLFLLADGFFRLFNED
jgi:hypothetical protein